MYVFTIVFLMEKSLQPDIIFYFSILIFQRHITQSSVFQEMWVMIAVVSVSWSPCQPAPCFLRHVFLVAHLFSMKAKHSFPEVDNNYFPLVACLLPVILNSPSPSPDPIPALLKTISTLRLFPLLNMLMKLWYFNSFVIYFLNYRPLICY